MNLKIGQFGFSKQDLVKVINGQHKSVLDACWDRIYVTTLFSFEWKRISEAIDFAVLASAEISTRTFSCVESQRRLCTRHF